MSEQGKPSAADRINALRSESKKGVEIAKILHQEGYDIDEVYNVFHDLGYVVGIEDKGIKILHVSDKVMGPGLATIIMAEEPRALPEVWWKKLPE